MARCQWCEGERVHWFTPVWFGREQGVFLCLTCGKVNVYYGPTRRAEPTALEEPAEQPRGLASIGRH